MNSKKGFTLVELLAVLLILAIVMAIGVRAVIPLISKAEKQSLAYDGISLIDIAEFVHQKEQEPDSTLKLSTTDSYCFSLDWLKAYEYYEKDDKNYNGSVFVVYNNEGKYDYYFWISSEHFHINSGTAAEYDVLDGKGDPEIINTCGNMAGDNITNINKFNITITCENCTLNKDHQTVIEGGSASFLATANEGYNLDDPAITGDCTFKGERLYVRNVTQDIECTLTAAEGESQAGNTVNPDEGEGTEVIDHARPIVPEGTLVEKIVNSNIEVQFVPGRYGYTSESDGYIFSTARNDDNSISLYFSGIMHNNWVVFGRYTEDGPVVGTRNYKMCNGCSTSIQIDRYNSIEECEEALSYYDPHSCVNTYKAGDYMYWRIIRTNSNQEGGGVRLLYSGSGPTSSAITHANNIGFVDKVAYNTARNRSEYGGYMYTKGLQHGHSTSSSIKSYIDNWYSTQGLMNYESYINKDAVFCNDRTVSAGVNWESLGSSFYYHNGYASYRCGIDDRGNYNETAANRLADKFSVTTYGGGNGYLTYPVGLLSYGEKIFGGGVENYYDFSGYLANGALVTNHYGFWLMTPAHWDNGLNVGMNVFTADYDGGIFYTWTDREELLRPVVSLKVSVTASGNGTPDNPYVITGY